MERYVSNYYPTVDQMAIDGGVVGVNDVPMDRWTPFVLRSDYDAQLADAQATIAALQARVRELEEWKHIVTGAGTDQESVIRLAAYEYTKIAVQCWKEANAKLESQLTQRTAECDALKLVNDTHMKTVMKLSHVVEQRTVELEVVNQQVTDERNLSNSWMKKHDELLAKVHKSGQFGAVVVQDVLKERDTLQAKLERVRDQFADLRKMVAALPKVEGAVVVSNGYVKDSTRCHALFGADEDAASYAALLKHRQGMEG